MTWAYVSVTLVAISFIASLGIWIWSLRTIRRSKDPVRKPFREASGTAFILTVGLFIAFLALVLGLAGVRLGDSGYAHLANITALWSNLADATMFAAMAYLTISIMRLQSPSLITVERSLKIRKYLTWGYFAVLAIMSAVDFGFTIHVMNKEKDLDNTYNDWSASAEGWNSVYEEKYDELAEAEATSGRIALSLVVLILLGNLGLLAEAVKMMVQTHTSRAVTTACHYFMAIVNVWLIRSLFRVINVAQYSILDPTLGTRARMLDWYRYVLGPILEYWPFIAALGVFIGLGARSYNGVWSHNVDGTRSDDHRDATKNDRGQHGSV